MTRTKQKKISFNDFDAARLYEWSLAVEQCSGKFECHCCPKIQERLEKFIGKDEAKSLRRLVKKHPYHKQSQRSVKK